MHSFLLHRQRLYRHRLHRRFALILAGLLFVAGCGVPPAPLGRTASRAEPLPPAGYELVPLLTGLSGPTQMIAGPDGRLWVAQLNGGENSATGQLLAIDLATGERTILLDGLLKPVGIAVTADALWIAGRREIWRAPLVNYLPSAPVAVLTELPFNGRSLGALTVSPQGNLLFETSGTHSNGMPVEGAARLWSLDPANPTAPAVIAKGLKNGYATAFDAAGRLWITDIGDDPVNGLAPPDELNLWAAGADFGWVRCFGMQEVAANYGGDAAGCAATRAPVALFPPRSTPTSVVPSPWAGDTLLVALWNEGRVVEVTVAPVGDNATGGVRPWLAGLVAPQSLLVWSDGSLLLADHGADTIYRIRPTSR